MKLFTASLVLLLTACSGNNKPLPDQDTRSSDLPPIITKDQSFEKYLYGTWQLTQLDGNQLNETDDYYGLKQTFLDDYTWLIGHENELDSSSVGGGRWMYDSNSKQISNLYLPDSISQTVILIDINDKRMETETPTGRRQTWRKTAELSDSIPRAENQIP